MKILITGATGKIMHTVAKKLIDSGHRTICPSRREIDSDDGVNYFQYKELNELKRLIDTEKPDVVINGVCQYNRTQIGMDDFLLANYFFGKELYESLGETGQQNLFVNIGTALPDDFNEYSRAKSLFDANSNIQKYEKTKLITIKPHIILCPGDSETKFPNMVAKSLLDPFAPLRLTSGTQRRDFLDISDFSNSIDFIISKFKSSGIAPRYIELGTGQDIPIKDFVNLGKSILNPDKFIEFGFFSQRINEPKSLRANTALALDYGITINKNIQKIIEKFFCQEGLRWQ